MSNLTLEALLNSGQYSQLNLGTAYASSVTLTDISPGGTVAGEAFTFPAGYLQVGQQFRVRAKGIISNTGTPNLTLGVYYGGTAGTALASTGAVATVTSLSNSVWSMEADLRVDATGTSGSIRTLASASGIYASPTFFPASSSGNNVTVDTSVAKILTIGATWGTNSASNSIQVVMFLVERLNEGSS